MPDFNKGDKTQQGMSGNGWVCGQLEFNHKRDVFIAVTSNEEEEGLGGVYINVHDDLNNLDYTLSGSELPVGESVIGGLIPSGTIEITENAEGIDVSGYAYADVNVSSGSKKVLVAPPQTVQMAGQDPIELIQLSGSYGTSIMPESITVTFDDVEETVTGTMNNGVIAYVATDYTIIYIPNSLPTMAILINDNLEHTVKVELEPRYYVLLHATFNNNGVGDTKPASEFFSGLMANYMYIIDDGEMVEASSILIPNGVPTLKDVIVPVEGIKFGLVCTITPTNLVNCTVSDKTIIFDQICAIEDAEATLWAAGVL